MIAICPNPFRDTGLTTTLAVRDLLSAHGYSCIICPVFSEDTEDLGEIGIELFELSDVIDSVTLAVVIGGDGTMLAVARQLEKKEIPLLGINLGTMGFMTAIEADEIEKVLEAASGKCCKSKRMLLEVSLIRNGKVVASDCALNDAVLHGYGDCIVVSAYSDNDRITSFTGDGIVVSTPTGSTGYSMSAGGPIVEPDAENFIISPICAHTIAAKSFVLGANRTITVSIDTLKGRKAYLSVDGTFTSDLCDGDLVIIKKSEESIVMLNTGEKSFYEIVYDKLM